MVNIFALYKYKQFIIRTAKLCQHLHSIRNILNWDAASLVQLRTQLPDKLVELAMQGSGHLQIVNIFYFALELT